MGKVAGADGRGWADRLRSIEPQEDGIPVGGVAAPAGMAGSVRVPPVGRGAPRRRARG